MRARLVLIPVALSAALVAGCANQGSDPAATPTPTQTPTLVDNGVAALSEDEILDKAKEALKNAGAFQLKGTLEDQGEKITVDVKVKGQNAAAVIDLDSTRKAEFVKVGTDSYVRADYVLEDVLKDNPPLLALTRGKYVKIPQDFQIPAGPGMALALVPQTFMKLTDPEELLKPQGSLTKGQTKTINGIPAIGLVDSDKSILYVATAGEPLPLQIENPDGSVANFTYETNVDVTAPPASAVVDASAFASS